MRKRDYLLLGLSLLAMMGCVQGQREKKTVELPAFLLAPVTLKVHDMPLAEAMGMLTKSFKFKYTVAENAEETAASATVKYEYFKNTPLSEVLTSMLAPLGLTYEYDAASDLVVLKLALQG